MDRESVPAADAEAAALVALLRSRRRPLEVYADLVEKTGSARPILDEEQGLLAPQLLEAARIDIAGWTARGIRPITVVDPDYPENLRAVYDRPALLFLLGWVARRDRRSVALIGSRRASPAAIGRTRALAEHLVASGYTIVSGLAAGIDTAAHTAALAAGGRTIAVIGTGLRHAYPPRNASLQRRIGAEGAVISQFWPDTPPARPNFPLRNALMSGVSLATIVVDATPTSGARTQVRAALAQGRPVLLAGKLLEQPWAKELAERPAIHVIRSLAELDEAIASFSADELVA